MILYHGTSTKFLDEILKKGILPRSVHGHSVYKEIEYESRPEYVYLTDRYPMFYAALTCQYLGGDPAIIQVNVPDALLLPDEEFVGTVLAQLTKSGKKRKRRVSMEREKKIITSIDPIDYPQHWQMSLKYMGTVATEEVSVKEIVKALKVPDDIGVQMAIGLDTNPQAGARYGIQQALFDQLPDRIPYPKALEILFTDGPDKLMELKREVSEKFMASLKTGGLK